MNLHHSTAKLSTGAIAFSLACIIFASCKKNNDPGQMPGMRPDVTFYGLTDNNRVIKYNAKTAEMPGAALVINGLSEGEKLLSIDFRPATGQLYGLGSSSRMYFINLNTGTATPLGTMAFTPALNSDVASLDFNPTVDRVRIVTDKGQNLRLNPETGGVAAVDGNINGISNASVASVAYTNSIAGATTTDLYDIDLTSKKLYKQTPPNDGTLQEVGSIKINFNGRSGFDINGDNSVALATFRVGMATKLYMINLSNAETKYLANLSAEIIDIAIPTNAVAYAVSENNMLQIFDPTKSNSAVGKTITGVITGHTLVGLDFRPANGQLYGLGVSSTGMGQVYTFNLSSGAAVAVGAGFAMGKNGTAAGFDFNPTVDRIRVVTTGGQNLRLNPADGTISATDGDLNPGTPIVSGAAYTNNFAGATSTELFVLDNEKLYKQNPPNNGTLVEIGNLGVSVDEQNGFDIGGTSNNAYALLTVSGTTKVYSINTATGKATPSSSFAMKVNAMAVGLGF